MTSSEKKKLEADEPQGHEKDLTPEQEKAREWAREKQVEWRNNEKESRPEYAHRGDELGRDRDKFAASEGDPDAVRALNDLTPKEEKEILENKERLREMDLEPDD